MRISAQPPTWASRRLFCSSDLAEARPCWRLLRRLLAGSGPQEEAVGALRAVAGVACFGAAVELGQRGPHLRADLADAEAHQSADVLVALLALREQAQHRLLVLAGSPPSSAASASFTLERTSPTLRPISAPMSS